ncbi:MAG: glycosyltransferase, partial [Candidatus Odinarchaeota archaeon]
MKPKNNTLLIGVIFPGLEKYLNDYCRSINTQNVNDFDILILNDNYPRSFPLRNDNIQIINIKKRMTPAEIRMFAIRNAVENRYKYIVFSDADDFFSKNRIFLSVKKLKKFNFVYNNLILVNESGEMIHQSFYDFFKIKKQYNSYLDIVDRNLFGLSHTSARVENLENLYIPKEIKAVDWWIFSVLLLSNCVGGFIKDTTTFYRQSDINLARINRKIDESLVFLGIKVKKIHYKNLLSFCRDKKISEAAELYSSKLDEIFKLGKYLKDDKFRKIYIEVINKNYNKINNGWWSYILPLKEWK